MKDAPKGVRLHIGIMGRRNAGKSTLLNALCGQNAAIVSPVPGTTTDPVEKTMELDQLGPVVLIDTAGVDDAGELGLMRNQRSLSLIDRLDMALLLTDGDLWEECERNLVKSLEESEIPFIIVRNKADLGNLLEADEWRKQNCLDAQTPVVELSAACMGGIEELRAKMFSLMAPGEEKSLVSDLVPAQGLVFLGVPIDSGAPKGRLILPQVQAIRDLLDGHCLCMVMKESELKRGLSLAKPDLVVCDSQVVKEVAAIVPEEIPFTTFSILMARSKGDLTSFAASARALANLAPGDHVVIQEACSHHPKKDDIGRVKIPRLLKTIAGGELKFTFLAGKESGEYPEKAKAVIHCGACVITAANMRRRQKKAQKLGLPMINYGMAISYAQGVLGRVLKPFPEASGAFNKNE